jgi:hypothetical protein
VGIVWISSCVSSGSNPGFSDPKVFLVFKKWNQSAGTCSFFSFLFQLPLCLLAGRQPQKKSKKNHPKTYTKKSKKPTKHQKQSNYGQSRIVDLVHLYQNKKKQTKKNKQKQTNKNKQKKQTKKNKQKKKNKKKNGQPYDHLYQLSRNDQP